MKLCVLTENTPASPEFEAEHGLSLYLETQAGEKLLFDTGQTDLFLRNAKRLGVSVPDVEMVFLSHGHYDHGGGLPAFLNANEKASVYVSDLAFSPCYHGEKYIGLNQNLRKNSRVIPVESERHFGPHITYFSCKNQPLLQPLDACGLTLREEKERPDPFLHEMYLLVEEQGKKILFSGCSHRGILNIVDWLRPDILVGGFHLMKTPVDEPGRKTLHALARKLLSYPTVYYTCHCTGVEQFSCLKEIMGGRLTYLSAGRCLQLP